MVMRIVVGLFFLFILYCLGSGVYYLLHSKDHGTSLVRALSWRIGLSLVLFLFILLAYWVGWLQPHSALFLQKLEAAREQQAASVIQPQHKEVGHGDSRH